MGLNIKGFGKKNRAGEGSPDFDVFEEYSDEEYEGGEESADEDEYYEEELEDEYYEEGVTEELDAEEINEYADEYEGVTEELDSEEINEYADEYEGVTEELDSEEIEAAAEEEYADDSSDDYAEDEYYDEDSSDRFEDQEFTDEDYMVGEASPGDITQVIGVPVPEVILEELDLSTAAINADAIEKAVSRRQLRKDPEFFEEVRAEQSEEEADDADYTEDAEVRDEDYDYRDDADYAEDSEYAEDAVIAEDGYADEAPAERPRRRNPEPRRKATSDDRSEYTDFDGGRTTPLEYIDESEYEEPVRESHPNIAFKISVLAASVALILLAIFGINYLKSRQPVNEAVFTFSEAGLPICNELMGVGSEIQDIDTIGGRGLLAALDARKNGNPGGVADATGDDTGSDHEYNETPLTVSTNVSLELITVKSDLKIRFINTETGKLIANVPFSVTITDPSGKTTTWSDDDLDGIIYKSGLKEGNYKVRTEALSDDKYSAYTWPAEKSVTVKSTIDYARVDVGGEVKDASQVNETAEDTSGRTGNEGQDLTNTVAFVESTSVPVYTEVAKNTITDPLASMTLQPGMGFPDEVILTADVSDNGSGEGGNSGTGGNGETGNGGNGESGNTGNGGNTGTETPAEKPSVTISLSVTTMSVKAGANGTFTASTTVKVAPGCSLSVSSSNTGVATASISGNTITVTGVAGGTADITVTATTDKNDKVTETATASAKCTVSVTSVDMSTPLTDKSGNEIYVFESNAYRRATYADYAKFDKFYIITGTKYTGWQTIGGATYYYNTDGKAVTGTQVIQGVTYQFGADGKMTSSSGVLGIDVSKWQGKIDWAAVKASGVEYVIIRVGYRGSTAGALIDDSMFASNISGAKAAGLKVGVYFVTQAINDVEAVYEASMVLDRIKGYSLDLPVFLDVEASGGRGDTIDKATRTAVCVAFCETIRNAGYKAGIYANKTWLGSKMDTSAFGSYTIWVAHYSSVCGYTGRYDIWQYSEKGTVSGINGYVDMNLKYT